MVCVGTLSSKHSQQFMRGLPLMGQSVSSKSLAKTQGSHCVLDHKAAALPDDQRMIRGDSFLHILCWISFSLFLGLYPTPFCSHSLHGWGHIRSQLLKRSQGSARDKRAIELRQQPQLLKLLYREIICLEHNSVFSELWIVKSRAILKWTNQTITEFFWVMM